MDAFDPEVLAELKARAKAQIRKRMRALRAAYSEPTLAQASSRIVERLLGLEAYQRANGIGLFWPISERHEVDLRALDSAARASQKRIYYPFLDGRETGFRRVDDPATLLTRGQPFFEPAPDAPRAARGDIDLLVVPALAVSGDGQRIGYGSGYYDATIPDFCPPAQALVVVYEFQLLAELPRTDADVRSDLIVTEARTLTASSAD